MAPVNEVTLGWARYCSIVLLVVMRISGIMLFVPLFSSATIAPRIKAGFVLAVTVLLAPAVAAIPSSAARVDLESVSGELAVGLMFGLSLSVLSEAIMFCGVLLGMEFSFSLVNLMDPSSLIETSVLGQILTWFNLLILIGVGLDRTILASFMRSFCIVPVGQFVMQAKTSATFAGMAGNIFLSGLQLAGPVITAALAVEIAIVLIGRMSPNLPVMVVGIPLKTIISYVVLISSLGVWPRWIEKHFTSLLDSAGRLLTA
jgi:flagellar biosynthetic protein FliR